MSFEAQAMIITSRDLHLLGDIRDIGLLTTRQIAARHFPSIAKTTVLRRLRKLESQHYLQRVTGSESFELGWALSEKGARAIGARDWRRRFRRDTLEHDIKLTSLRFALSEAGIARSWIAEHDIRAQVARRDGIRGIQDRIIPDGLMGVHAHGVSESVAVELELHFKNSDRYVRTFRDYSRKDNLAYVWYVVESESLGRNLMKLWKENVRRNGSVALVWSNFSDVLSEPLNASVYSLDQESKLTELWTPLAHPVAQGVSTQGDSSANLESNTTHEYRRQTLALAP
jgi:hypothetical protein